MAEELNTAEILKNGDFFALVELVNSGGIPNPKSEDIVKIAQKF